MTASLLLIVNPHSSKKATGRNWPKFEPALRRILPPFNVARTKHAGDAIDLAAEAADRYETIAAVGGDGTISEVANGILNSGCQTALGIIPRGTGSDLVRTLSISHKLGGAARILARGHRRTIDVGRATFLDPAGEERSRWFINAAEVGFGAMVSDAVNQPGRWLPGPAAFMWAIIKTLFRFKPSDVTITIDSSSPRTILLNNAWAANGCYSGGGIRSAPRALMDDGLLDFVVAEHASLLVRLSGLPKFRSGKFTEMRHVQYSQAKTATFTAETPQLVELDGDVVGTTPVRFEVVPAGLTVVAP
ncbi:MAG: diacylglycerol kinase family lipid kinase [Chloroflexi bacterium]|nr:diacylglycerol kinase family lipid kinase [Chloroflexota bacterium]